MKVFILSLLATVALSVTFNSHASCTSFEAACTGSISDASTCLGQDYLVTTNLTAEGVDASTATAWNAAGMMALTRHAYQVNFVHNGAFAIHTDLEPIYRCTAEANGLTWAASTACFDEWASCIGDATCLATWNAAVATPAAAMGVPFTALTHGTTTVQALGGVPFTPMIDGTTPMVAAMIGGVVATADMSGNGKIMAMTACMVKDWAATDIQAAYAPCFDLAVQCSQTTACADASANIKTCAADKGKKAVTMQTNSVFTNIWELQTGASHEDWCTVGACGAEEGNSLYMALGACGMDALGMSYKKCYDDMMGQIAMMMVLVGGGSFVVGVLGFTMGWCFMCKGGNKAAHGVDA